MTDSLAPVRRGVSKGEVAGLVGRASFVARPCEAMVGTIHQLSCSRGGVPKLAVEEALLTPTGLDCDAQLDLRYHGGPERALCLFSLEVIRALQAEGHPIAPGTTGENVTVEGVEWGALRPGSRLALGDEVLVEITGYASPCKTISGSFSDGVSTRISQRKYPGESRLYARVLKRGRLAVGQRVEVLGAEEVAPAGA